MILKNDFIDLTTPTNRKYAGWVDLAAFVMGGLTAFVDAHIWSPATTYFCVLALVMLDFISGVWVGHRSPAGIETRKAKKVLGTLVAYTAFMFFAHKFSRSEPSLFWMPQAVLAPIVVINFGSLIKNASLLGFLPEKIAEWLYKNIDKYKNPNQNETPVYPETANLAQSSELVSAEDDRHLISH